MNSLVRCFCGAFILTASLMVGAERSIAGPQAASPSDVRRTPIVEVFERTHQAVVNISTTQVIRSRRHLSPFDMFFDDQLNPDDFFQPSVRKATSVGSGFVIHPSGYIVTNAHVVNNTIDRKVGFDDGRSFEAAIVALDVEHDLALLKIQTDHPLPTITFGRSDDLMVGETVIAIGNPLGYQNTLTSGVVSAVQRKLEIPDRQTGQTVVYPDLIQIDAPINPGNSGGPLLNVLGELIGINTAIRGDAQNIGFAIPVHSLQQMLPAMLQSEQHNRFFLGINVDEDRRITEVAPQSPAQRASVKVGDVITGVNDRPAATALDYYFDLIDRNAGDTVTLHLNHDGTERKVRVLLQEKLPPNGEELAWEKLGLKLQPLTAETAKSMRLRPDAGLLIAEIHPNGPSDIGIVRNDVLTFIGRYHVTDLNEVGDLLKDTKSGDKIYVEILRVDQQNGTVAMYRDGATVRIR